MTLYLTESMPPEEIIKAKESGIVFACKYYPAGATTHSSKGVRDINNIKPILQAMEDNDLPLLIHGEVTNPRTNIIDRENQFIETQLKPLLNDFPKLRIVLEHISTQKAVEFVLEAPDNVAATITAHHLLLNLNDLLGDGIRPHYYCKPILKQIEDQKALIQAATSGNPKFFLGTDSAPHSQSAKECSVGCAGVYTAHAAIELYAEVFDRHQSLDKLANFAGRFGAEFYKLPVNTKALTLTKSAWQVPHSLSFGDEEIIPLFAGQMIQWQINHEK